MLSQLHVLADFTGRLATLQSIEGELLPSDYFDLIGGSGIAAYVSFLAPSPQTATISFLKFLEIRLAALCIGPLKMTVKEAIEALQILGLSVFYESHNESRATIFDSSELREAVRNMIEDAGFSPAGMIGMVDPKSRSKS